MISLLGINIKILEHKGGKDKQTTGARIGNFIDSKWKGVKITAARDIKGVK